MATDDTDGTLKAAEKMFKIVETIREFNGARVTELVTETGLAKSTVHRHVKTLEKHHYLVKEGDTYRIGLKFFNVGEYARRQRDGYDLARPHVDKLAEETEERALFIVEEHGRAVYLYRGIGENAVKTNSRSGTIRYLHTLAGGKAILAHLPDSRVDEIIDRWGLPAKTDETITSRDALYAELEEIRERGYAFNHGEAIEGMHAVAVPVLRPNGGVYGSLNVSGPAHRVKGEWFKEQIPDLLLGTANALEINLAHD